MMPQRKNDPQPMALPLTGDALVRWMQLDYEYQSSLYRMSCMTVDGVGSAVRPNTPNDLQPVPRTAPNHEPS